MKTTSIIFTFTVAVFFTGVPSCFSADQQYEDCLAPLRCGSGPTLLPSITYPFWGVNKPNYCGQREFQLSCKNGQNLTLDVKNLSLRVISFSKENQTLTVADENLFEGGCPYMSLNFTGSNEFPIAPTVDKIDLFTCPGSQSVNPLSPFTCGRSNGDMVTYYAFKPLDPVRDCLKFGEVPVLRSVKNDFQRSKLTLAKALVKGFDLRYTIRDSKSCSGCLFSGGVCGSVPGSESFQCLCLDRPHDSTCQAEDTRGTGNGRPKIIIGVMGGGGGVVILLIIVALVLWKVKTCSQKDRNLEALIPLKRYSYAHVKKITKSFRREVGKGGFGNVYRGKLSDGRKVAVKVLKESKSNGEDFINEVASMSKTSHVNIVTLLGFCYEGSKRAIIYEYLGNGSLDKFISGKTPMNMDWMTLYRIALGVARGLEYLHHGCKTRIVHFDIKPHNVLLDENFCPKVSDFGLAKLCEKKESVLSLLDTRGTIGYIAPEMISRVYGNVSHKSDVYSYGMLVLEMIGARNKEKAIQAFASNTSSIYFPEWVYRDLEKSERHIENGINSEDSLLGKKMTLVGLWCIQPSPPDRPSMNRVVEMMEGSLDALEVPPRPVYQIPTVPLQEPSTFSEDISVYIEG